MANRVVKVDRFEYVDADGYPRAARPGDTVELSPAQEKQADAAGALEPLKQRRSKPEAPAPEEA